MRNDFVSFVTHQLRTPLSGIKWMLELAGEADGRRTRRRRTSAMRTSRPTG